MDSLIDVRPCSPNSHLRTREVQGFRFSTIVKTMVECSGQVAKHSLPSSGVARRGIGVKLHERVDYVCDVGTSVDGEADQFPDQFGVGRTKVYGFRVGRCGVSERSLRVGRDSQSTFRPVRRSQSSPYRRTSSPVLSRSNRLPSIVELTHPCSHPQSVRVPEEDQ